MAKITTIKTHTSGIPLGGIGCGSVELLPTVNFTIGRLPIHQD